MTSTVDVLTAHGIARGPDVVTICVRVGLEPAAAAVLLELESGGGRNVWGHDPVATAGWYVPGSVVTRVAYLDYRRARTSRTLQGVGPCQLTSADLQDAADALGGCWDWYWNAVVGFGHLASLMKASGARNGFRSYNGSGPAAEAYADHAMNGNDATAGLAAWRSRLAAVEVDDMEWTDKAIPDYAGQGSKPVPDLLQADVTLGWLAAHAGEANAKLDGVLDRLTAIEKKLGLA